MAWKLFSACSYRMQLFLSRPRKIISVLFQIFSLSGIAVLTLVVVNWTSQTAHCKETSWCLFRVIGRLIAVHFDVKMCISNRELELSVGTAKDDLSGLDTQVLSDLVTF